jgi:hypothetical protein
LQKVPPVGRAQVGPARSVEGVDDKAELERRNGAPSASTVGVIAHICLNATLNRHPRIQIGDRKAVNGRSVSTGNINPADGGLLERRVQ